MSKISFTKPTETVPTPVAGVAVECVTTLGPVGNAGPVGCPGVPGPVIDVPSVVVPATEIPTAPVCTTVAVIPPVAVPAATDSPIEFDDNDIKFDEVYLPRVNIVQKVGDLSLVFNPGEVVLNQTFVIHVPADALKKIVGDAPLNITFIGFKKRQYAEKVKGNVQGLLVNTEAEVVAAGGTLAYKEWDQSVKANEKDPTVPVKKYFQPLATALILIERPATLKDEGDINFPYECEGKHYALALWSMKGTSYTNAAKHVFTARKLGHLKTGYTARGWSFTTKIEKYGENFAAIPVLRPADASGDALRTFIGEIIGCAGK